MEAATEDEVEVGTEAWAEAEAGTTSSRWSASRQPGQRPQVAVAQDEESAAQASRWSATRVVDVPPRHSMSNSRQQPDGRRGRRAGQDSGHALSPSPAQGWRQCLPRAPWRLFRAAFALDPVQISSGGDIHPGRADEKPGRPDLS